MTTMQLVVTWHRPNLWCGGRPHRALQSITSIVSLQTRDQL